MYLSDSLAVVLLAYHYSFHASIWQAVDSSYLFEISYFIKGKDREGSLKKTRVSGLCTWGRSPTSKRMNTNKYLGVEVDDAVPTTLCRGNGRLDKLDLGGRNKGR